jgi:hypothetical protein
MLDHRFRTVTETRASTSKGHPMIAEMFPYNFRTDEMIPSVSD